MRLVPDGDDPVDGGDEEPHEGGPDAAEAAGPAGAADGDGFVGAGAGTEGGEGLEEFAEAAAAHEVVFLAFDAAHGPEADGDHGGEVEPEDGVVDPGHGVGIVSVLWGFGEGEVLLIR